MSAQKPNRFTPTLDVLEERCLLAGNVSVSVSAGDLVITGDSKANYVTVSQIDTDSFKVAGWSRDGSRTKVNGKSTAQTFHGVFDDFRIYLNGGNDRVDVLGTSTKRLTVPGDLSIESGDGDDYLKLNYLNTRGDILIDTGSGKDRTYASNFQAYDDMTVQEYWSNSGDYEYVNIKNFRVGSLSYVGTLTMDLSSGNDRVYLDSGTVDHLQADLWDGDDYLSIKRTQVNRSSDLDGGSGYDGLNLYDNDQGFTYSNFNKYTKLK